MDTPHTTSQRLNQDLCLAYIAKNLLALAPANLSATTFGIELEVLPFFCPAEKQKKPALRPQLLPFNQGKPNLFALLHELVQAQAWQLLLEEHSSAQRPLLGKIVTDHHDYFTCEPGGQLEFSSAPFVSFSAARLRLTAVQRQLDQLFAAHHATLLQVGANPWYSVEEIGLRFTKPRYLAMDAYFSRLSPLGRKMMRQTASIQVSLDAGNDEETMVERYLASQLLSPFAAALFANSPYIGGEKPSSIDGHRAHIWANFEAARSGFPALTKICNERSLAACQQSYLDFLLAAPVIFISSLDFRVPTAPLTFAHWLREGYQGIMPSIEDFSVHCSLHFPEVRPRGTFLELRSVDCQARLWQLVPAAFFAGLLYDSKARQAILGRLLPFVDKLPQLHGAAAYGLQQAEIAEIAAFLMSQAEAGFSRLPANFRDPETTQALQLFNKCFTAEGKTPGGALRQAVLAEGRDFPHLDTYRRIEEHWQDLFA